MEKRKSTFSYQTLACDSGNLWHHAKGLNDMFITGCYKVRLSHADIQSLNISVDMCNADHYIIGYLFVTESGTNDKLQKDRLVGQTLIITDCTGNSQQRFTRTCSFAAQGYQWSTWECYPDVANLKELETQLATSIEWGDATNINTFVTAGTYNITGYRTSSADNLPMTNASPGHSIHARLIVLDSSISGSMQNDDKCVTQILSLSNRTGGDGDIYVRTGRALFKNMLAGGSGWEPWGKLQQNIAVGHTTSLDDYIENAMYSGVYSNGTAVETFIMVVINNYAVAGSNNTIRSVSQFKYALNIDGTFSYRSRSGQGNTGISWGQWVDLNGATTAMLQDGAVTAQKLSADVREKVDNPLRPLYIAAGAEYNDTGADIAKTAPWGETVTHKAGHYYLNGLGDITEEQMMDIYNYKDAIKYLPKREGYRNSPVRTYFAPYEILGQKEGQYTHSAFITNSCLEVILWSSYNLNINATNTSIMYNSLGSHSMFYGCKKLKVIYPMNVKSAATMEVNNFYGCSSLVEVRLFNLMLNTGFKDSPNISKQSILYIVNNAVPTTAITITLHPDAYARLADDADIVAALEAQPLVSLVSA